MILYYRELNIADNYLIQINLSQQLSNLNAQTTNLEHSFIIQNQMISKFGFFKCLSIIIKSIIRSII